MAADDEATLRQILLAIDALARRVEALEQRRGASGGNVGEHLLKAIASSRFRPPEREVDPELSAKRSAASRARWGESIEGTRHVRLAMARARGQHTEDEWLALLEVCGFKCLKCGSTKVVKDHIIPIHHDGSSDAIDNLQPLCRPCNTSKGRDHADLRPADWRNLINAKSLQHRSKDDASQYVDSSGTYDASAMQTSLQHRSNIAPKVDANQDELSTGLRTATKRRKVADAGSPDEPPATVASSAKVWVAYAAAYKLRYGIFPVRNARVNSMLKQFVSRVSMAEAPAIAEFYVADTEPLYVKAAHCIDLLLRDAEKVRMAWATGRRINGHDGAGKPWWEVWGGIEAMGKELGVEQGDNPTTFKNAVLRAAADAGRLPEAVQQKLGMA